MDHLRRAVVWPCLAAACAVSVAVAAACSGGDGGSSGDDVVLPDRVPPGAEGGANGCSTRCADDTTLETCPDGVTVTPVPCALGCNAAESRCFVLDPAGVAAPEDLTGATAAIDLSASGDYVLDADDGSLRGPGGMVRAAGTGAVSGITYRVADQPDGTKLAVFGARSLVVGSNATLRIKGTHAAAIVVSEDAVLDGTLSVSGDCDANAPGPGGYGPDDGGGAGRPGASTICAIINNVIIRCGGGAGGAGHGTDGGKGGTAANANGGSGGAAGDAGAFVITGGSGGGSPAAIVSDGIGGAGGGGVQIAAGRAVRVNGTVEASACGGRIAAGVTNGGAGGGAGGMIVLEAATIEIGGKGIVAANGGGGASGSSTGVGSAAPGANATANGAPAPGGAANACPGGRGGAVDASPGDGTSCAPGGQKRMAAGGGGAAGRVVVHGSLSGAPAAIVSPAAEVSAALDKK